MECQLPASWRAQLSAELAAPYFAQLEAFVDGERAKHEIYPAESDVFRAFRETPFDAVRVVLLGQDPYHGPGQAHGLCFSVPAGVALPPSLRNMFRELETELGKPAPKSGDLTPWAKRGVLLLNTVLTVRAAEAGSHQKQGWERFTDAAITALSRRSRPLVFALWGKPAAQKRKLVDEQRHRVLTAAHPSPLSAHRGFLGTKPFAAISQALIELGEPPIDFSLP
jgi:uracil-DNA glycosylase